jgi:hypothetical protein
LGLVFINLTGGLKMSRKTYFGLAFSGSMIRNSLPCVLLCEEIRPQTLCGRELISCLNPSHKSTLEVLKKKYPEIQVEIPDKAPIIELSQGDRLIVFQVSGLPRREGIAEYTEEEIARAEFFFLEYSVFSQTEDIFCEECSIAGAYPHCHNLVPDECQSIAGCHFGRKIKMT